MADQNKDNSAKDNRPKGAGSDWPELRFTIPLPNGRVARIPAAVVEKYVEDDARVSHGVSSPPAKGGDNPKTTTIAAGENMITINIYAGADGVTVTQQQEGSDDDVIAHSMSVDASTGTSEWHTDWEHGECEYTDESGFPQQIQAWHRHPFGTEYSELYEG